MGPATKPYQRSEFLMGQSNSASIDEEIVYQRCLAEGRPYFGPHLFARNGPLHTHLYLQALVDAQLARSAPVSHILEIGSWAGASALTWANAVLSLTGKYPFILCVDPWRQYFNPKEICTDHERYPVYCELAAIANSGKIFELFLHNIGSMGLREYVHPFRGTSAQLLPLLCEQSFDVVYIDGDHSYDAVLVDLKESSRLVREGGILCGDDLKLQLHEADWAANDENKNRDRIRDPRTGVFYHPGVARAVGEFFGPVSSWEGVWAMRKSANGWSPVELETPPRFTLPTHLFTGNQVE